MATTRFIDHLLTGDHASRPSAGSVPQGTLYACSTHETIYQSDGVSTWNTWRAAGSGAVSSVFGRTGAVTAAPGDYAVADVTGAAPLASPTFTGTPAAPTAAPGTNTTQLATTAFVEQEIAAATTGVSSVTGSGGITTSPTTGAVGVTLDTSFTDALYASPAYVDAAVAAAQPAAQGSWLVSGGGVAGSASSYDFIVSAATYYINGVLYASPQTTITLDAADATNDRFDAIVLTTSGTVAKVTGTAASNPALPDLDPNTELARTYVLVAAASSAPAGVTLTTIYAENAEWTSSVSGGTITAASTNNPHGGTKDVEATAAAAGDYVRFTSSAVSLASEKQLVLWLRSKAAWPSQKSLAVTWYSGTTKVGQSASIKASGTYGFASSTTGSYQQVVIPIGDFAVPATSTVTRLEFKVTGGGGTIGWYLDDVVLESNATSVTPPAATPKATASVSGTVKTDTTDADPVVYLKASTDTLLAAKAPLASPAFTGNPTATTQSPGNNSTRLATTAYVDAAVTAGGGATNLDGLSDVTITSPTSGDFLRNDGAGQFVNTPLVAGDIPNLAASKITSGQLALARGGTGADLSATGGTSQVLKQTSSGGAVSVGQLAFSDLSGTASSAQIASSVALAGSPTTTTQSSGDNSTKIATTAFVTDAVAKQKEVLMIAVSDETTAITTGTAKVTFRMPFAMTVTEVRANLNTASGSGNPAIDVNKNGSSIFSTTLTIDATEKTSTTATTPAVISTSSLSDDDEITIDIDTAGSGAKGLKVSLIGTRT